MSTTTFKFRANTPNLNVLVASAPSGVNFNDHVFSTDNAVLAQQLRTHKACGAEFSEETAPLQAAIARVVADNGGVDNPKDPDAAQAEPGKPGKPGKK
ncbi:MAG: hypothetical protein ACKVZJ_10315 [Phycisphaerales bacterium]